MSLLDAVLLAAGWLDRLWERFSYRDGDRNRVRGGHGDFQHAHGCRADLLEHGIRVKPDLDFLTGYEPNYVAAWQAFSKNIVIPLDSLQSFKA